MTTRRLNKKVALIGSGVFLLLLLAAIALLLQLGRDPQEYISDAEAALTAAHDAPDKQTKDQDYQTAKRSFQRAYGRARTDSLREAILLRMADMYLETRDWNYVLGCWDQIIKVNPSNAKARYGRLKYFYILAGSGSANAWQQVQEQASEFLKVAQSAGLLIEDTAQWDVPELERDAAGGQRLGPYLYLLRARAALEMASLGTVTNPDESLAQAVDDLKKVQEYDPNNIYAFLYLARAAVTRGELFAARGSFDERDKAGKQAVAILEQAVALADSDPSANIDLLILKLKLARDSGSTALREQIRSLEPEYLSLVNKFSSSARAFAALSTFYSEYSAYAGPRLDAENLQKAIEAAEKAMSLDPNNVAHAINAANLNYRRFSIYGDKPQADKAVEIARNALALPDAQDTTGPRQRVNRFNRYKLCALLANCYIEQIREARAAGESVRVEILLTQAEQAVHQIEQVFGSGEEPWVVKWRGMIELARGDDEAAVRTLYTAYEQLRAVMPPQPPWPRDQELAELSYTLAGIFKDTSEIGAVLEFLTSAVYSGISDIKPEAYLDYVDVLLTLNYYPDALRNIDAYEEFFGSSRRSQELRVRTYIGARQFAEAETELEKVPENEPYAIKLRLALAQARIRDVRLRIRQRTRQENSEFVFEPAEPQTKPPVSPQADVPQSMTQDLEKYSQREAELLEKLLSLEPRSVEEASLINVCGNLIAQGKTDQAGRLVGRFSESYPDSVAVLVYKRILSENRPTKRPAWSVLPCAIR